MLERGTVKAETMPTVPAWSRTMPYSVSQGAGGQAPAVPVTSRSPSQCHPRRLHLESFEQWANRCVMDATMKPRPERQRILTNPAKPRVNPATPAAPAEAVSRERQPTAAPSPTAERLCRTRSPERQFPAFE